MAGRILETKDDKLETKDDKNDDLPQQINDADILLENGMLLPDDDIASLKEEMLGKPYGRYHKKNMKKKGQYGAVIGEKGLYLVCRNNLNFL